MLWYPESIMFAPRQTTPVPDRRLAGDGNSAGDGRLAGDGRPVDADALLRELSHRWQGAQTLEYRSRAVMRHAGEFRVVVEIHARLRRPNLARVVFHADRPDVTRLRVCDGRRIWDRTPDVPLRPGQTTAEAFGGLVTANIPHPLDETAYSVDQFFAPAPFTPRWATPPRREATLLPATAADGERFRITLSDGRYAVDTLTLDAVSLRPRELVRVNEHAGQVQELLRETFLDVRLGSPLPPALFAWTPADESGETLVRATRT